jgi:hypothetical protein
VHATANRRSSASPFVSTVLSMAVLSGLVLTSFAPSPVGASTQEEVTRTDGTRTLVVSATDDLDPVAQTLRIRGTGYDTDKGIYVGLCAVQGPDQQPSPCGGGIDKSGSSGSSAWISSNPPAYGIGLAVPYGDSGSFDVEITVSAAVNAALDCRRVECAIVTKNDHTIISDRSQDVIIPVTFSGEAPPLPSSTIAAPSDGTQSDDSVAEITVSSGVEDLTSVATSNDGGSGWVPIVIGLGVLAALSSIVFVSIRRTSARRGR